MSVKVARLPITVGVGGFMVRDDRLLVVRRTYSPVKGLWTIPSGYVEPRESVAMTLTREVREETGIEGEVGEILAVRNRVTARRNDTFLVFRMTYRSGEPRPDEREVSAAAFVPLEDLAHSEESAPFTQVVVERLVGADGLPRDSYDPGREMDLHYLLYVRPGTKGL